MKVFYDGAKVTRWAGHLQNNEQHTQLEDAGYTKLFDSQ